MTSLQVLVSTMNRSSIDPLIKDMRIGGGYVVINQLTSLNDVPEKVIKGGEKFLSYSEKGLSKSRNKALENASADIVLIADDDMYFEDDYIKTILNSYENYPDADMIAFYVDDEVISRRKKPLREGRLSLVQTMKLNSIQISMKLDSIKNAQIAFDENFGAGTEQYMGEENIFLFDCAKKGLKVFYVPIKIATLEADTVSTWFKGYDETYFRVRGATFRRMTRLGTIPLIVQFAIRKRRIYKDSFNVFSAINLMISGAYGKK